MAGKIMVTNALTQEMIDVGRDIVRRLDDQGFDVTAALWRYERERDEYDLLLASARVGRIGLRQAYVAVQSVLADMPTETGSLDFNRIILVDVNDPDVELLRKAITTGSGFAMKRVRNSVVEGRLFEDLFVYRLT